MKSIFMDFRSSSIKRRSGCPFRVLVFVDSIVVTGFVQRRRCIVELWCWRDYELVSVSFLLKKIHFCLLAFVFVLFRGNEDGWWICFGSMILSENLESGFLDWRYGFFSSGVVQLDAYLDSTWMVLSWCCSKGLGA